MDENADYQPAIVRLVPFRRMDRQSIGMQQQLNKQGKRH